MNKDFFSKIEKNMSIVNIVEDRFTKRIRGTAKIVQYYFCILAKQRTADLLATLLEICVKLHILNKS